LNTSSRLSPGTRIVDVIAILYSIVVVAFSTPRFTGIPVVITAIYYLFVPGFVFLQYLNEDYAIIQKIAFSIVLGLALILVVFSLQQIAGPSFFPFDIVVPVLTIFLVVFNYYRIRKPSLIVNES